MNPLHDASDGRRFAPATDRNREPLREALHPVLGSARQVLEVASGTGQHAVFLARAYPGLRWQPTDADAGALRSIDAWRAAEGLDSVLPARLLDVEEEPWPERLDGPFDVLVCINMVHISPWSATEALLRNAGRVLGADGCVALYGPYTEAGVPTAPSNLAFDASLRARDARWGLRPLEAVLGAAARHGFARAEVTRMPSHNLTVLLQRG